MNISKTPKLLTKSPKLLNLDSNQGKFFQDIVIAVCTYNNANLLERTLSCIENQEVNCNCAWSVIVINNNCTDRTSNIVEKYINKGHINLQMVNEPIQGLAYARRRAVLETNSELIAFVDDDCFLSTNWINQAISFSRKHLNAGAIGSRVKLLWEVEPPTELMQFQGYLASYDLGDSPLQVKSYLVGAGLVVRRTALLESGWLNQMLLIDRQPESLTSGGDSEIVLRIQNAGYEVWYNSQMQLQHYIPQKRISVDYYCRLLRGIGKSLPFLQILGSDSASKLARFYILFQALRYFCRMLITFIYRYKFQKNHSSVSLIYFYHSIGFFEGALNLFFTKINI